MARFSVSALLVLQVAGQGNAPKVFDNYHFNSFAGAVCFVDVGQATLFLGQAGLYIDAARKACNKHYDPTRGLDQAHWTEQEMAHCSESISSVVYSFSFVASYISAAASNCAHTLNLAGYCASDVTNLVADLGVLAASASGMHATCNRDEYGYYLHGPHPLEQIGAAKVRDQIANALATRRLSTVIGALTAVREQKLQEAAAPEVQSHETPHGLHWPSAEEMKKIKEAFAHAINNKEEMKKLKEEFAHAINNNDHNDKAFHDVQKQNDNAIHDVQKQKLQEASEAVGRSHGAVLSLKGLGDYFAQHKSEHQPEHKQQQQHHPVARLPPPAVFGPALAANHLMNGGAWSRKVTYRQNEIAQCTFDIAQATFFLTRAGLGLTAAIRECDASSQEEGPPGSAKLRCSVDVTGLIGSFSFAAAAVSMAVSQCPVGRNLDAHCAADIALAVAGVAGVATSGSSFLLTCGQLGKPQQSFVPRHLAANNDTSSLEREGGAAGAEELVSNNHSNIIINNNNNETARSSSTPPLIV